MCDRLVYPNLLGMGISLNSLTPTDALWRLGGAPAAWPPMDSSNQEAIIKAQQAMNAQDMANLSRGQAGLYKTKQQKAQEYAAEVRKRKFLVKRIDNVEAE